jgi:transposase
MHFPVINVKVQAAIGFEDAPGFDKAGFQKAQEVVKNIAVRLGAKFNSGVTLPHESGAIT